MSAPARLLSVRLQGFKSFAERTHVTFGPGISAVVGPNGSGKSNLADALRWALGEQGRALRSRKSEDVIWAGSDKRAAVGMADVQLVLDNADGLLSVDYGVVELGRRLYRSGENDYLLNRGRVRLRDLVDLLDAAHLAENAFLFIGQGMVDQALALRPEERRPLFEEVAGVRRHERRRRRAEEQLAESEANLTRVEDIVAELRPQARRLAQQAEQQATRETAGDDLATALLATAHARWHAAAERLTATGTAHAASRSAVDGAMSALLQAEAAAQVVATSLAARASGAAERRAEADAARAAVTELRIVEGRLGADLAAVRRDRGRLAAERTAAEQDLATQRRRLSEPAPARDHALESALSEAERLLAEALAEVATLRAAARARDADIAALRRAEAARSAEAETARRRLEDAERAAALEDARAAEARLGRDAAVAEAEAAAAGLAAAVEAERAAAAERERATTALERLEAEAAAARTAESAAASAAAALTGRLEDATRAISEADRGALAAAVRRLGARRLDEDLLVEPELRAAVDAALAGTARGFVVARDDVARIDGGRGTLVVREAVERQVPTDRSAAAFLESVIARGGGSLATAIRRDASGSAARLLARVAWVPDLATAMDLMPSIPPGWLMVPRDGSAVVGEVVVALGRADGALERQAQLERIRADLERAEAARETAREAVTAREAAVGAARERAREARDAESSAGAARRRAEEAERAAARTGEARSRESAWHAAQSARLHAEAERLAEAAAAAERTAVGVSGGTADTTPDEGDGATAIDAWEERAAALRERRDRLAAQAAEADGIRHEAERRRAAAEAAIALDARTIETAERDEARLADREQELGSEIERTRSELAAASFRADAARAALDTLLAEDATDRDRLAAAERDAAAARERLRVAEERERGAERADLEARLALENLREQLLVELAGLGGLGLRHLRAVAGDGPAASQGVSEPSVDRVEEAADREAAGPELGAVAEGDDAADLERAVERAAKVWAAAPAPAELPSPGRLAGLRRRYHELGAANPYAVEEYAALRARLDGLETQATDLRSAIERTRDLVAELDTLIADHFRTTFQALEARFDARFRQLFGGGYAHLSLTDPNDLAATGIEIVARPPGKKQQALAMLSGGERALTAVALLFAMLEVRPVPFCVLDEVDAALDEANVGRFTTALRELAERTQFIVITHNRGTIETADALYGVTVGEDSVSRVISLRLDEATEIAERVRTASGAVPAGAV